MDPYVFADDIACVSSACLSCVHCTCMCNSVCVCVHDRTNVVFIGVCWVVSDGM